MKQIYCCAGPEFYSCLCGVCMRVCRTTHQQHTRIGYLIITVISFLLGLIFLYSGTDYMETWEHYGYECKGDKKAVCMAQNTIYRESFSLTTFYLLMSLSSYFTGRYTSLANRNSQSGSCWPIKVLFISIIFILTLFIPDNFFV